MTALNWHSQKLKLKDLRDYEHNPRTITKKDFDRLVKSIQEDGYHSRILVDTFNKNTIIGGHSRKKALLKAGFKDEEEIEILAPSRPLTDNEFKRLNVRDNLSFGAFDFDVLANHFDFPSLLEWGFPPELIASNDEKLNEVKEELKDKMICEMCGKVL